MGDKIFAILFIVITLGLAGANLYAHYYEKAVLAQIENDDAAHAPYQSATFEWAAGKSYVADVYYRIQLAMGKKAFNNFALVKAQNSELNPGSFIVHAATDLRVTARFYGELNAVAQRYGGKMLYYNPPLRPALSYQAYQPGMPWLDLNPKADSFLNYLREYGVHFTDARYSLVNSGILAPEEIMNKTDLLWTNNAAFAAFKDVVRTLENELDAPLDTEKIYTNEDNYDFINFPNFFLGEFGQASSGVLAGYDNFTAIMPKFNNRYLVESLSNTLGFIKKEGDAAQTLYIAENLEKPASSKFFSHTGFLPYSYYLHGLNVMSTITNLDRPNGPKVLVVHDAYALPVGCLLAPMTSELTMINPLLGQYTPDLKKYVADKKFDIIIIMISIYSI